MFARAKKTFWQCSCQASSGRVHKFLFVPSYWFPRLAKDLWSPSKLKASHHKCAKYIIYFPHSPLAPSNLLVQLEDVLFLKRLVFQHATFHVEGYPCLDALGLEAERCSAVLKTKWSMLLLSYFETHQQRISWTDFPVLPGCPCFELRRLQGRRHVLNICRAPCDFCPALSPPDFVSSQWYVELCFKNSCFL